MVWYSLFFKNFPQFVSHSLIHKVKGFSIINEAEVDIFLEFSCFLHNLTSVGNFISGSSALLNPAYIKYVYASLKNGNVIIY